MPFSMKPIHLLSSLIKGHSIVLLQECFCNLYYDDIEYEFPEYNIVKGTMSGYRLVNSGLVLLSLYPIIKHYFISYSTQKYLSSDILAEKGFIVALVKFGVHSIYIINTHLQSSTSKEDEQTALSQWRELYNHVNTLEYPWIIGGDFNLNYSTIMKHVHPYSIYTTLTPTIYIEYKNKIETDTSCISKEGYEGFAFDYFITHRLAVDTPITIPFNYSDNLPVKTLIKK